MSTMPAGLVPLVSYVRQTLGYRRSGGVIGDTEHLYGYHLGKDRIFGWQGYGWDDYSIQTSRDRAGLNDNAAAIDIGNDWPLHADWLTWLVASCRQGRFPDIREVIGSFDGKHVLGWDQENRWITEPDRGDETHLWHTHISFYRDSVSKSQVDVLRTYFTPPAKPSVKLTPSMREVQSWGVAPTKGATIGTGIRQVGMPWWFGFYQFAGVAAAGVTMWLLRRRMGMSNEDT